MFGTGNAKDSSGKKGAANAPGSKSSNSLVQGTYVEGKITTESDFRIDGKLVGDLRCKGKLIIGPSGIIEGNIECQNAMIQGTFSGTLVVHELLQVMESARIEGEVDTTKLIVQAGSSFNVTCVMGGKKRKRLDQEVEGREVERLSKVAQSA